MLAFESLHSHNSEKKKRLIEHIGQFRLRLPKSLHAALADRAEFEGVSLNSLAVQYIVQGLSEAKTLARINHELQQVIKVDWQFTTDDARIKLKRLYPVLKEQNST